MMDVKTEFFTNQINQCLEIITSSKKITKLRIRNVFLYPNFIFNLTYMRQKMRKNQNFTKFFTDKLIQIYTLNKQNTKTKYETTQKTLLDILIEASHEHKFPQKMIHDNLITMLLAASDTTAVTMNFAILMLANFPEIQEKVYKELWEIYGLIIPKSAPIKYEDLEHMNYLDCFIKETMRLFPSIPIVGRYLTKDVKIGEFILPKGAEVFLEILQVHRSEKYWRNPLVFDPDRFLHEKTSSYNNYYIPFGLGPRNCIEETSIEQENATEEIANTCYWNEIRHNKNISHTLEDFNIISLSDSDISTQRENVEMKVIANKFDQNEMI